MYFLATSHTESGLKPKFHGSSFLVASSYHARGHVRHARHLRNKLRGCRACRVVLPVCPYVVSLSKCHASDMHDLLRTCQRHARPSWHVDVVWKSLASAFHPRPTRPTRPISSWHVSDNLMTFATRMLRGNCSRGILACMHLTTICSFFLFFVGSWFCGS